MRWADLYCPPSMALAPVSAHSFLKSCHAFTFLLCTVGPTR